MPAPVLSRNTAARRKENQSLCMPAVCQAPLKVFYVSCRQTSGWDPAPPNLSQLMYPCTSQSVGCSKSRVLSANHSLKNRCW